MINFITSRSYDISLFNKKNTDALEYDVDIGYIKSSPDQLLNELSKFDILELDTETTMVPDGPNAVDDRELLVVQIGTPNDQYIFDIMDLDSKWTKMLVDLLSNRDIAFIAHNANFEYKVLASWKNIDLYNIHDTFIMSKMLSSGITRPKGYHGLAGLVYRHFGISLDKSAQTTFTKELLSLEQIVYAAYDVTFMKDLFLILKADIEKWGMWDLYNNIERKLVRIYAKMELAPMGFDEKHWKKVADNVAIELEKSTKLLNDTVLADSKLVEYIKADSFGILGRHMIQPKDEYFLNWRSSIFKNKALRILVPELPDGVTTKPVLIKYINENKNKLLPPKLRILNAYIDGNYDMINSILKRKYKKFLEDNKYFIKKGTLDINWNSSDDKLFLFRFYYPNLESTAAKAILRITANKLISLYKKHSGISKSASTYGMSFIDNYVRRDGTISPSGIKQILSTGRIAFGILLQIPKKNLYRNAFYPLGADRVFLDADYSSAELAIMSVQANETNFLNIIRSGKDAHSASANLVYGKRWTDVAEPDCEWVKTGEKCNCKNHKILRTKSKSVSFGLAYGLSIKGLAERLDIPMSEAKELYEGYFKAFPEFQKYFDRNAAFALKHFYISTGPPFNRKRFFEIPSNRMEESSIERKAKNAPIQGASADMLKLALIKLTDKIENAVWVGGDMIIHLPIHDEILASVSETDKAQGKRLLEESMIEAAEEFLGKGLMKADVDESKVWQKN